MPGMTDVLFSAIVAFDDKSPYHNERAIGLLDLLELMSIHKG